MPNCRYTNRHHRCRHPQVSIAPFSLETLEHILDHFAPSSSSTPHVGFAPGPPATAAPSGPGRATSPAGAPYGRASSPPGVSAALRHSTVGSHAVAAIHAGHSQGGRASTAPGVPRPGVLKDSAGAGPGAAGQGAARGRAGVNRQASLGALGAVGLAHGALPGIPPGATPPALSSRAAAVLQVRAGGWERQREVNRVLGWGLRSGIHGLWASCCVVVTLRAAERCDTELCGSP